MLEHLHENEWGVGRGPKLVIRFSMDGACVESVIFYFIHTNADELKGSVKLQLLKLALHICHHLSARHRNTAWRRGSLWAGGIQVAVEMVVLTQSDGWLGNTESQS